MRTPILHTDRLDLRPFTVEDAQDVFECWESDPDVAKYMFWCSHNDIEKTKNWVRKEQDKVTDPNWCARRSSLKRTGTSQLNHCLL